MLTILSWCPHQNPPAPCDQCPPSQCGWINAFPGGVAPGSDNVFHIQGNGANPGNCHPTVHLFQSGFAPTGEWTDWSAPTWSIVSFTAQIKLGGSVIFNASASLPFAGGGSGFAIPFQEMYLDVPLPFFPFDIEFLISGQGSPIWVNTPGITIIISNESCSEARDH